MRLPAAVLASIPPNHGFDHPLGLTLLHGTEYHLGVRDGEDNLLAWSYYGSGHPLQDILAHALDELASCAETKALAP